jgi:hypothetical protein
MDEREQLLLDIWTSYKPYNRAADDKWRSYVVSSIEADTLEAEDTCVTIFNGVNGLYA